MQNIINIVYLDSNNAVFEEKNDFLSLKANLPVEDAETNETKIEEKFFERVYLQRLFPFDDINSFISVMDGDSNEIGLIKSITCFDEQTAAKLNRELSRKYYTPIIKRIISLKERYGFSFWTVETDSGEVQFTLQDTYKSILRASPIRVFINDIDGNRFEIPNLTELDTKSMRKIELYL